MKSNLGLKAAEERATSLNASERENRDENTLRSSYRQLNMLQRYEKLEHLHRSAIRAK